MLTVPEYLKAHKNKYILKVPLYLISVLIIYLALWAWPLLEKTFSLQWHHKLLMSLMALMILWIVILHSYIKYSYKENDLKLLLEKYIQDDKFGFLIHKETNKYFCTNCLYTNSKEVEVIKIESSYSHIKYKCPITSCGQTYPPEIREPGSVGHWRKK